ncbi:conjugal transfer protein, partial [Salmonella enterica subsp. enterica serovar Chicago]|nr:conjugal transfer protein [Salmonella enterica subsp. enterica serovar Chicago]
TSSKAGVYGNESDHDKTVRFPSRPKTELSEINQNMDLAPSIPFKINCKPNLKHHNP